MSTAVSKSKKKINLDYNFIIKGGLVLGGLYFGYKIINSLFKAVGLAPDKDQIKKDVDLNQSIQDTNFVLSSALIQDLQSKGLRYQDLEYNLAKKLSSDFWNAWSFGILDEKILLTIFSQIKYQSQVSVLSGWFEGAHGKTLIDHISNHLSSIFSTDADEAAIQQIFNNIKRMPLGLIK